MNNFLLMNLYKEQNSLIDRPIDYNIEDKLQELINEVEEFRNANQFVNIQDYYDKLFDKQYYGCYNLSITSTNNLDSEIIETLLSICYKYKSSIIVLKKLEEILNQKVL